MTLGALGSSAQPRKTGQGETVQELLDFIIGLGDNSEMQKDKELSDLFQSKADELFRLSGSTDLNSEDQIFSRMAHQLISEDNKISAFMRKRLLESGISSNPPGPQVSIASSTSTTTAVSDVNTRNVSENGEALTPLAIAARLGDIDAIRHLVAEGAQVDGKCTAYLSESDYYPYWITCDPNIPRRKKLAAEIRCAYRPPSCSTRIDQAWG